MLEVPLGRWRRVCLSFRFFFLVKKLTLWRVEEAQTCTGSLATSYICERWRPTEIKRTVNNISIIQYIHFHPLNLLSLLIPFLGDVTTEPKSGQTNLAQPIVTRTFDGIPPEELGILVSKALASFLVYHTDSRPHTRWVAEFLLGYGSAVTQGHILVTHF
jgi:hypothetical protein